MKLNILVVDDETPICEWLVYCIRKASPDYVVQAANNGEEAYEKILHWKPDIVFTDIRMPGMDGLELMKAVLEVLPFTTFAILTNYAEFTYAKQAVSLGAREYFLKSELRAADLEKLLQVVMESKVKARTTKVNDVYRDGCIDLYNFYKTQEQPGYADRFWEKHGMWKDVPYQILCITAGRGSEQWREVADTAEKLRLESGGKAYLAVACEMGFDYVVVQAHEARQILIEELLRSLQVRGYMGVSAVHTDRNDFASGLREAAEAKRMGFFETKNTNGIFYTDLLGRPALDRRRLREEREQLLSQIHKRNYGEALAELEQWFSHIAQPGCQDIKWAIDDCRRMVLSVEELYYQEFKNAKAELTMAQTAQGCWQWCRQMVDEMERNQKARCSPSIAAAVEYIHAHYQENISMTDVARQIYRSPEYFSRQFKEEVGDNFNSYLTLYRLERAQELLDKTDLRIAEIAERVGYVTPGYFSRIYKKYKGISPEQARISKK